MERQRLSGSRMPSLSKLVLVFHESLLVSSSFVIRLAVFSGMDVKRENYVKGYHDFVGLKFKIFDFDEKGISVVNCMG